MTMTGRGPQGWASVAGLGKSGITDPPGGQDVEELRGPRNKAEEAKGQHAQPGEHGVWRAWWTMTSAANGIAGGTG